MSLNLPEAINIYFAISNGADIAKVTDCFCADALVKDENKTWQGHAAIQQWQHEAHRAFDYSVEPINVINQDPRYTVTSHVEGNFPGSPVQLTHAFVLSAGKIASLEIV